jgi:hypothetical protein
MNLVFDILRSTPVFGWKEMYDLFFLARVRRSRRGAGLDYNLAKHETEKEGYSHLAPCPESILRLPDSGDAAKVLNITKRPVDYRTYYAAQA